MSDTPQSPASNQGPVTIERDARGFYASRGGERITQNFPKAIDAQFAAQHAPPGSPAAAESKPAAPPPPADPAAARVGPAPGAENEAVAGDSVEGGSAYDFNLPGVTWSDADRQALKGWSDVFTFNEIPAPVGRAAVEAYSELAAGKVGAPLPHSYRIPPEMGLTDEDKPYLDVALGKLAAAGASEDHVLAILRNFQDAGAAARKPGARGPIKRPDWNELGSEQKPPQAAAPATRKVYSVLARRYIDEPVQTQGETSDAAGAAAELAEIERWMRSPRNSPDGKRYWNSNVAQARYRTLLQIVGKA